jgi:hypothetical protein
MQVSKCNKQLPSWVCVCLCALCCVWDQQLDHMNVDIVCVYVCVYCGARCCILTNRAELSRKTRKIAFLSLMIKGGRSSLIHLFILFFYFLRVPSPWNFCALASDSWPEQYNTQTAGAKRGLYRQLEREKIPTQHLLLLVCSFVCTVLLEECFH